VPHRVVRRGRIVIRADADQAIGIGHVGRTIALAEAWRRGGGDVRYVATAPLADQAAAWIRSAGFALDVLDVARYSDEDAGRTAGIADAASVVLDVYGTPAAYRASLRARGCRLAVIDDLGGAGPWLADVIVNQNYGAAASLYPDHEAHASLLLGPRYALLRPEFARWRGRRRDWSGRATRVVVSFGGADPKDTGSRALAALTALSGSGWRAILAAGAANPRAEALKRRALASGRRIHVVRRPSSMARLLAWADVALLAGGSTVWEAFCVGVPTIGIAIADNQVPAAEALARDGCWHYLGRSEQVTEAAITKAVSWLLGDADARRGLSEAGRALVDGEGAERVADALQRLQA
jgi:UDP-2,4-diacetamido-2,4,6-trideoxy-beta-L-altropyranose hydrolase